MNRLYNSHSPRKGDLEPFHTYLLPEIERLLSKEETILDAGCGYGVIANQLIDKGFDVYGVDASKDRVAIADRKHPGRFAVSDLEANSLPERWAAMKFDTIISTEVIEHLYAPRKFLSLCKKKVNGGGVMES